MGDISKEYGISAMKLNKFLYDCHVQYKPSGSEAWQLYTAHADKNLAQTKLVELDNGRTVPMLLWTPKGRDFIDDLTEEKSPRWYAG